MTRALASRQHRRSGRGSRPGRTAGRPGGAGVGTLCRAEIFSIRTTRSLWLPLVLLPLVHVGPMAAWGADMTDEATWNALRPRSGLLAGYVMMVFAVLLTAQHYRYRTATLSWLATPARHRTLLAQLLVAAVVAGTTTAVIFGGWVLAGAVRHGPHAVRLDAPGELAAAFAVTALGVVGAAVVGGCVATIVRSATAALLCLAGSFAAELAVSQIRFLGPTTGPLRLLAWPTSEGSTRATVAVASWIVVGAVAAAVAQRRDLTGG